MMKSFRWLLLSLLLLLAALPGRSLASEQGEVKDLYLSMQYFNYADIAGYVEQVKLDNLNEVAYDLVTLYGPRHPNYYQPYVGDTCKPDGSTHRKNNLIRSLEYLEGELKSYGYTVRREIVPEQSGAFNLIAERDGLAVPGITIEIGAHIDSQPTTPGASDNASGVAAMAEIAHTLRKFPNRYTWRFIAFIGEEIGLKGSRYHTSQLASNNESIKAALVLDGIGWSETSPEHMNCIWDAGDDEGIRLANLFDQARTQYKIDIGWRRCKATGNQYSDNVAYWEQGYPAVLSIGGLPYVDPEYHKCNDTIANTDLVNAYKTAQQNLAVLLMLDSEDLTMQQPVRMLAPWMEMLEVEGH